MGSWNTGGVVCTVCSTNNDVSDHYCRECGSKLQRELKISQKELLDGIKKIILLLSVYATVDVLVITLSYLLFINQLKTLPVIDYEINSSSNLFYIITFALVGISFVLFIVHTILFGIYLTKLTTSKDTWEYKLLYLFVPMIHITLFFGVFLVLFYVHNIYVLFIISYIFIGEWLPNGGFFLYRFLKPLLKSNLSSEELAERKALEKQLIKERELAKQQSQKRK